LLGYMRSLSSEFVKQWNKRIINVHPSLLPKYAGGMDLHVHEAVLQAKETETGCTVHYVAEGLDNGPIITQKRCPVDPQHDTPLLLKQRIQVLLIHPNANYISRSLF